MSSTVGTGQVIASTSIVEKVQQWQQSVGDNQQKEIQKRQEEENERKRKTVSEAEKQDRISLHQKKEKENDSESQQYENSDTDEQSGEHSGKAKDHPADERPKKRIHVIV